jgi:hypothetical protein
MSLKPPRRTVRIIFRNSNQTMSHWVVMDIVQPRPITTLKYQTCIPILKSNLPTAIPIYSIDITSSLRV